MTRALSGAAIAASQAPNVAPIILVEMDLDSGIVRVCSHSYDFVWGGYTWLAVGQLGQIETVREAETGQVSGLKFSLSSIPSGYLSSALTENCQGRAVKMYVGFLAVPAHTIVVDPVIEWSGTIDTMIVIDDGATGDIQITAENEMFDFARPRPLNWGDAEQQAAYPGDLGLQYVSQMSTVQVIWPAAAFFAR